MADAFHQVAVAGDDIGIVIDQIVAEAGVQDTLRQRHADRGGDALAERAGRRLDAAGLQHFRMARRLAAEAGGTASAHRSSSPRSPSGGAGCRAASSRGRRTARSGRGRATAAPWDRTSGTCRTARSRRRPCPSACPDARISRLRPRPWQGRESHWPTARAGRRQGLQGSRRRWATSAWLRCSRFCSGLQATVLTTTAVSAITPMRAGVYVQASRI